MFPIQEQLLTVNKYSRPGTKLKSIEGIVIHWTANENATADADANIRFFENRKYGRTGYGSAHYFVDSEKIMRCVPDHEMAYHVGAKSYKTTRFGSYPNNCLLGIEMCVNSDGNFKIVYEQTVLLTAMLMKKYGLDVDSDLVRHFDITGKNCPAYFTSNHWGKTNNAYAVKYGVGTNADAAWLVFKEAVKKAMNPSKSAPKPAPAPTVWYRVRKSWEDAASQKAAFRNKDSAIAEAKRHAGYKVFEGEQGKQVYPEVAQAPAPAKEVWYRVRKTWADEGSQKGAFHDLDGAKKRANEHPGYSVFDENGKVLYTSPVAAPAPKPVVEYETHKVVRGDTLSHLALAYKTTVAAIKKLNGLKSDTIYVGQVLKMKKRTAAVPKPTPAPAPAPSVKYPLPTGTFRQGARGEAVKQIQRALNACYFRCAINGVYDADTFDAVKRFQSVYCNPPTGVFDAKTKSALHNKVN